MARRSPPSHLHRHRRSRPFRLLCVTDELPNDDLLDKPCNLCSNLAAASCRWVPLHAGHSRGEVGWPTGLEPATFGATIRGTTAWPDVTASDQDLTIGRHDGPT